MAEEQCNQELLRLRQNAILQAQQMQKRSKFPQEVKRETCSQNRTEESSAAKAVSEPQPVCQPSKEEKHFLCSERNALSAKNNVGGFSEEEIMLLILLLTLWQEKADSSLLLALVYLLL